MFDNITNVLYENMFDLIVLYGDFNSRVHKEQDNIDGVNTVPQRVVIDDVVNNHDSSLCDFITACKLDIANGRLCPLNDNFTRISTKGKSFIAFVIISQENIDNLQNFEIIPVSTMLESLSLQQGVSGRMSDHSILRCEIMMYQT